MNAIRERLSFCRCGLCVFLLTFFLTLDRLSIISARFLEGEEILVGNWKTVFRCSPTFFASELFPLQRINNHSNQIDDNPRSLFHRAIKTFIPAKSYKCNLVVFANKTFELVPECTDCKQRLCLHGVWSIQANPYCATDRFYDQLVLESYRRSLKQISGDRIKDQPATTKKRIKLLLRSRLFGHYSASRSGNKDGFARGKLTHGVLFVNRERIPNCSSKHVDSQIAGSFSGIRIIKSRASLRSRQEENYIQQFGY